MRSSMRQVAVYSVLGLAALLGVAGVAVAEPLELEWDAPDGCPDREAVEKLVSRQMGERVTTKLSAPLSASGRVALTSGAYTLTLRTPTGDRRLEAETCDELAEGAAVILALLIDPHAAPTQPPEPEPEPNEPDPEAAAGTTREASPPMAANDAKRVLRGFLRPELIGDAGLLPRVGLGLGFAGGVTWYRATFELSGTFFPTHDLRSGQTDLGDLRAFTGRIGVCDAWLARPALGPCFFMEYARLIASGGEGLTPMGKIVDGGLWSLLPAARLAMAIGASFGWVLELGIGLPLSVAAFTVENRGTLHETSRLVGRARTGFELRF
jgi:hypothetical protein